MFNDGNNGIKYVTINFTGIEQCHELFERLKSNRVRWIVTQEKS